MAAATVMPYLACEHLTESTLSKIRKARLSRSKDPNQDLIQYTCLDCPVSGGFASLTKHFDKTKHDFAVGPRSIYCGICNDLVYDSSLFQTKKKRKVSESDEEDNLYLTTNTSQRPCGREGVRGLFNLGETCYMNAVLQMMVHNPLLASYFLGMGHPVHLCPISREPEKKNESDSEDDVASEDKPEQKTCVACGMTEVFADATQAETSLPAHAVNLLFASWKNISVSGFGPKRFLQR